MFLIVLGMLAAFSVLVWMVVQIRTLTDNSRIPNFEDVRRAGQLFRTLAWILSASVVGAAIWIGHFACTAPGGTDPVSGESARRQSALNSPADSRS